MAAGPWARRLTATVVFLAALGLVACGKTARSSGGATSVRLSEFKVTLASATLSVGHKTLVIVNSGSAQHELLVFRSDLSPAQYPLDDKGDIAEEGPGIVKVSDGDNIDPAKSQTREVDLTAPGAYLFVCNLPGHFKAGMYSLVTVR